MINKEVKKDIREKCEIQKIHDWIKCRRENWYARVERRSEDRILKKILMNKPAGKRRRGRTKKTLAGRVRINRP